MSFRSWVTFITFLLLAALIYFARDQITDAWELMARVDIAIWLLIIPAQFISYYVTGKIMFVYLKSKGDLKGVSRFTMTRVALELNFVNHILPSGGAAGVSYLSWALQKHGVAPSRSTMAQIVRYVMTFVTFVILLLIALMMLILDHTISPIITLMVMVLIIGIIAGTVLLVYAVSDHKRLVAFSHWVTRNVNRLFRVFSMNKTALKHDVVEKFFSGLHYDYLEIRREKAILIKPFWWALINNMIDGLLFFIIFWSLGTVINPATLFIAFGLSSLASVLSILPGGAGLYEATMIAFLASAGVPHDVAIAGTLLARVSLLTGTIVFGYAFYQLTINRYGRAK
jgi:putative heme transporter